jgi:hypothetical protein
MKLTRIARRRGQTVGAVRLAAVGAAVTLTAGLTASCGLRGADRQIRGRQAGRDGDPLGKRLGGRGCDGDAGDGG